MQRLRRLIVKEFLELRMNPRLFGLVIIAASWILDEVAGWTIFVSNLLAAAAMLSYYFRRHRTLAHRLTAAWADDDN